MTSTGTRDRHDDRLPSSLRGFPRNQALRDRTATTKPPASSPSTPRPCRRVAMDDLTVAPRPRPAAIKGGLPSLKSSHHQHPLPSEPLLDHLHRHISHRSPPISPPEPVEPPQKEENIGATSSGTTRTRRAAVLDNIAAHIADHRRSAGELSYPLPAPSVSPPLAGDDDGRAPFDPILIQRPREKLTVSWFK
jgi:hypothetical protein